MPIHTYRLFQHPTNQNVCPQHQQQQQPKQQQPQHHRASRTRRCRAQCGPLCSSAVALAVLLLRVVRRRLRDVCGRRRVPPLRVRHVCVVRAVQAHHRACSGGGGFGLRPFIICDEEMLPESLLSKRPVSAKRIDGTCREELGALFLFFCIIIYDIGRRGLLRALRTNLTYPLTIK